MNKLVLFLPLLVLIATSVQAISSNANGTVMLNGSSDAQVQLKVNITLMVNHTLTIDPISVNPQLTYRYPSEIFYDNAVEELTFNISRSLVFTENKTISSTFLISNDLNNNTINYTIITHVFVDPQPPDFFIEIINGNYHVNISTELIPKSGSLSYEIAGAAGTTLHIDCSAAWLTCPSSKVFGSNNKTTFNIDYLVPSSADLGITVRPVSFTTGNLTLNSNITFNIFDPGLEINTYVFSEDCFVVTDEGELTVTLECIQEKEEHDIQRLSNIINKIKQDFNATCEPEIQEKLVYYGDITQQVADELTSCRSTRDDLIQDVRSFEESVSSKQRELNTCNNNLQTAKQQLLNNESACLQNTFATSVQLKNQADEIVAQGLLQAKEHRAGTIWMIILILFILGSCVALAVYFKASRKHSWTG